MKKSIAWVALGLSTVLFTGCQEVKDFFTTPHITVPPSLTSLSVTVDGQAFQGQIHEMDKTVTVFVPEGTDLAVTTTEYDYFGQEAAPASGFPHDYTMGPALITLTKDELTVMYHVSVVVSSVVAPTSFAEVAGTWTGTLSYPTTVWDQDENGNDVKYPAQMQMDRRVVLGLDGSYFSARKSIITPSDGVHLESTNYEEVRGTFGFTEYGLEVIQTESRDSNTPFTDDAGWSPRNDSYTAPTLLLNGKLLFGMNSILIAQGTHDGLSGTWGYVTSSRYDGEGVSYHKFEATFTETTMTMVNFSGSTVDTLTQDGEPNTATYTITDTNRLDYVDTESGNSNFFYFRIIGDYFIAAPVGDGAMGGLTKVIE